MGIRRHLKATLGLLAVGSVAFAGSAFAGSNTFDVNQSAGGDVVAKNYDESGAYKQIGDSNNVYVKEQAAGNDSSDTAKILLEQYGNSNSVAVNNSQTAGGNALIKVKQGTDSSAVEGNVIAVGTQTATNGNATLHVQQYTDHNSVHINNSTANNNNDFEIVQEGTSYNVILIDTQNAGGNQTSQITQDGSSSTAHSHLDISQQTAALDISNTVHQTADSNGINDITIAIQNSTGGSITNNLTQQNSGDNANQITIASQTASNDIVNTMSQSGNGDQISVSVQTAGADINNNITQSGAGDVVTVETQTANSGHIYNTVTQTGDSNNVVLNQSADQNIDVTISMNGNNNLARIKGSSTSGSDTVNITVNGSDTKIAGVSYDSSSGTLTFNQSGYARQSAQNDNTLTITAGSSDTFGIYQEASSGANTFSANVGDDNVNLVYQVASSGDNSVNITEGSTNYASVYQNGGTNSLTLNLTDTNKVLGSYLDSDNHVVAYASSDDMPAVQTGADTNVMDIEVASGNTNTFAIHQEASTENYFHASVNGSNNNIYVYQTASTTAYADITVASDGNTLKIHQNSASGSATVEAYVE